MKKVLINQKLNIKISFLSSLIVISFYFSWLINLITGNIYHLLQFVIGISSILFLPKIKNIFNNHIKFLLVINFLILLSFNFSSNLSFVSLVIYASYSLVSLLLLNYRLNFPLSILSFVIHCLIFSYFIITNQNPNEIFVYSSRNYVSVVMIIQTMLVYISTIQHNKKVHILPAVIAFLLSVWGVGRAGIFSSTLILIGVILHKLYRSKITNNLSPKIMKILFISPILLLVVVVVWPTFTDYLLPEIADSFDIALNKMTSKTISQDPRFYLNMQYLDYISENLASLLFGANYSNIPILRYFNLNPHNSFIRLHSIYGFFGILIYSILILKSMYRYIKNKNILYFLFLFSILFRISTDIIAFPGIIDPIIIYFIFNNEFDDNVNKIM